MFTDCFHSCSFRTLDQRDLTLVDCFYTNHLYRHTILRMAVLSCWSHSLFQASYSPNLSVIVHPANMFKETELPVSPFASGIPSAGFLCVVTYGCPSGSIYYRKCFSIAFSFKSLIFSRSFALAHVSHPLRRPLQANVSRISVFFKNFLLCSSRGDDPHSNSFLCIFFSAQFGKRLRVMTATTATKTIMVMISSLPPL